MYEQPAYPENSRTALRRFHQWCRAYFTHRPHLTWTAWTTWWPVPSGRSCDWITTGCDRCDSRPRFSIGSSRQLV